MLPTCDEEMTEGYMTLYLGAIPEMAAFAYEFAKRKYAWREKGLAALEQAKLQAECHAGAHDAGDEGGGRFTRTFTEKTLGLALNVDRKGRVFVNRAREPSPEPSQPCTLYPVLCTLHPAPRTPHRAPRTLNHAPSPPTLHTHANPHPPVTLYPNLHPPL